MIPPIFCISLARAADRRRRMAGHMSDLGLRCEMIDAVDGKAVSAADHRIFVEDEFWRVHRGRRLSPGEVGCFLSHYRLWQKIFVQKIPCALVLEDDAVLDSDIGGIVARVMECEAEWDVVILHAKNLTPMMLFALLAVGATWCAFAAALGRRSPISSPTRRRKSWWIIARLFAPGGLALRGMVAQWLEILRRSPAAAATTAKNPPFKFCQKCPRSSGEHLSALCYRFADWNLRRRMLDEAKQQTKKEQQ